MAEIDTAAPFASVRDAIYMFGEYSDGKTQRAFSTNYALQLEKIHLLEVELYQLREEHEDTQNQLLIAKNNATDVVKELTQTKNVLEENNLKAKNVIASKISLLESQLDTTLKQETQRSQELECSREEIKNLSFELNDFKVQHKKTLDTLKRTQEENDKLRNDIVHETNALAYKHKQYLKEQEDIARERMKDLLEDLFATKDMLAKADAAREKVEKEFQTSTEISLERVKDEVYNSNIVIQKLRNELQHAKSQQEEIILVVEKLEDELLTTKEVEKKAIQAETDANLALKMMKIEVEDSKVAKEKVRMMVIQLEDMNTKLKNATQEENNLLASLASLKAKLKNAINEVQNVKKEAKETATEMEEHINQLQFDLDAAIVGEAKTKKCLSNLNEALQQVTAEAVETKATATQAIEELIVKTQELGETLLYNKTLECRLQAAIKETEATRASEIFAQTEIKFYKEKVNSNTDANRNGEEVTISYDEYETMAKKVVDSEDLAKKQIAAAIAQVDASKASELEISKKIESMKHLLERSQMAMKEAVQVAEAAEVAKSAIEGELRKWRSENEQRLKATVAAVMAVGSNEVAKNGSSIVIGDNSYYQKPTSVIESNRRLSNSSPNALQPRESLTQVLRYNFLRDEKTKKNLFSTKISSYFSKKVK